MRLAMLVFALTLVGCAHTRSVLPNPEKVPVVVRGPDQGITIRFNGEQGSADSLYVCMTSLRGTALEMDCVPYVQFIESLQEQFNTTDAS